ncbi:hypothetical protein L228DRAFT_236739 [Xylona heveae TC161]|uniref:Uncharacterized protein n=1 Tax=Xylona heveae (strain CBS 132557 / TC161) TaxID=1328760 RepID=A0A165J343_XYLHT|nr:hypothetical protein L228DRAFT_236739 [Xylona heveae TC161]KZF25665.1 hypothetical protein L228DRAFT_236739 [Xylona heveae TC161]
MGLPVFREPAAAEPKVATKADASAQSRSAIRRQRAVRHSPTRPRPVSLAAYRLTPNNEDNGVRALMEILRGDRTPAADLSADSERLQAEFSHRRSMESGRSILQDALSYERPGRRMREVFAPSRRLPPPLPPVPEPRDYSGTMSPEEADLAPEYLQPYVRRLQSSSQPNNRTDGLPSGPNTSALRLGSASLTPRFAPAYLFDGNRTEMRRSDAAENSMHFEDGIPDNRNAGIDDLPPLRRVGHRSILDGPIFERPSRTRQESHRSLGAMDGLGDRERSFSPEDDPWETLLTTITPDTQLPSPDSFSSALASASSFTSNPATTGGLHLPPLSSESSASIHICDVPTEFEDSDTEAEGDADRNHGNPSSRPVQSLFGLSDNIRDGSEDSSRVPHDYLDRRGFETYNREHELQQLQSILSRLGRMNNTLRESAGLTRPESRREREA